MQINSSSVASLCYIDAKYKHLPITGKQHTPMRNSADPTRKTINIIMAYPSRPPIENGVGTGGNGGGIGHDISQSTHEHAGINAYLNKYIFIQLIYVLRKKLTLIALLHGIIGGSCGT